MDLGGSASAKNEELYRLIAHKIGLTKQEQEFDPRYQSSKWIYEVQWVRYNLVQKGEMDGSTRGIWKITEKGRERVRRQPIDEPEVFTQAASLFEKEPTEDNGASDEVLDTNDSAEAMLETFAARFVPESIESIKGQLLLEDTPIHQIVTIINTNRNVILTGPPGTGKTSIAINTCEQAVAANFISGYVLTTATSDWTTFDTVGGYMPRPDQALVFTPGIVLRTLRENKWLIVDEINRADIDKAFGQLLTVLSGQDVELPFADENGLPIRVCRAQGLRSYYDTEKATYFVGDNWRVLGTMNTFDKNSLFYLSYAFMRRFGFVHINIPSHSQLSRIIDGRVLDGHLQEADAACVKHLLTVSPRSFGAAILIDILNYIQERNAPQAFFEVLVAYVLPQYEGLSVETLVEFHKRIADVLTDADTQRLLKRYLAEMFAIEPELWEVTA